MKTIKNIIIANDTEAFSNIIRSIKDPKHRAAKVAKENFLCGRFLFWENDNKIVITPSPIDKEILSQSLCIGQKNVENWVPRMTGTNLSRAICEDSLLFQKLGKVIRDNPGVILSPYCYTSEFSSLVRKLKTQSPEFTVDQLPKNGESSLVEYLGSKAGFRSELKKMSKGPSVIPQPTFFICEILREVIKRVAWFNERRISCVIKANSGEGGWGVLFIKHQKYPDGTVLQKRLVREFKRDSIWKRGPYVVEEYVASNDTPDRSPSIELFINERGCRVTYVCNQVIDPSGKFIGVLIGKNCIKKSFESRVRKIGMMIGKRYARLGYRGFFDIDFIASKSGEMYPIETNVRRTGGTHVFDFVKYSFGPKWYDKIAALSSDLFVYGKKKLTVKQIFGRISPIKFPMNKKREGVIIVALSDDKPMFSFIIVGTTKKRILAIHQRLNKIFSR